MLVKYLRRSYGIYISMLKFLLCRSLQEGVGMVALEAAAYGCEIVLTNYGAPKEYYGGRAILVNPMNVDEIGEAIMTAMNRGYAQQN